VTEIVTKLIKLIEEKLRFESHLRENSRNIKFAMHVRMVLYETLSLFLELLLPKNTAISICVAMHIRMVLYETLSLFLELLFPKNTTISICVSIAQCVKALMLDMKVLRSIPDRSKIFCV